MTGTTRRDRTNKTRRRLRGSAVVASLAATVLLVLSVAAAAQTEPPTNPTLVLRQLVDGELRCVSSDASCIGVDLYGQNGNRITAPIRPGEQRTTTVELANAGDIAATSLDIAPGPCENEALDGGTPAGDLCATVTLTVACDAGGTTLSLGPESLTSFGQNGSHTVDLDLAAGASATCQFTITYPEDAPPLGEALRAVQPVTWTLMAPELPPPSPPGSPPPPPRALPVTGTNTPILALAGAALLLVGVALHRLSRHPVGPTPGAGSTC